MTYFLTTPLGAYSWCPSHKAARLHCSFILESNLGNNHACHRALNGCIILLHGCNFMKLLYFLPTLLGSQYNSKVMSKFLDSNLLKTSVPLPFWTLYRAGNCVQSTHCVTGNRSNSFLLCRSWSRPLLQFEAVLSALVRVSIMESYKNDELQLWPAYIYE